MRDGLAVAGGVMIRRGAMEELLLLALLGLGGAPIIRWFRRAFGSPEAVSGDSARALLRRRYAAGEITREQFEEMRQTLLRHDLAGEDRRAAGRAAAEPSQSWPR